MLSCPLTDLFRKLSVHRAFILFVPTLLLATFGSPAHALDQWASSVLGFSSQYSATGAWSSFQALFTPNTFGYGDAGTAFETSSKNGGVEWLELGFDTPVHATGVTVRETEGNGYVTQIEVLDTNNALHTVWTGTDPSPAKVASNTLFSWQQTSYLVKGVKITFNTALNQDEWEAIDAVELHSPDVPAGPVGPQWAESVLGYSSAYSMTDSNSPDKILYIPDVFKYGDDYHAWAPGGKDGNDHEYIEAGFDVPVHSSGVMVRETSGNGFITQIDAVDTNGGLHTVWTGTDLSQPGKPVDFHAFWPATSYLTKGVKISLSTNHALGEWEEIDAVQLFDAAADINVWATGVVGFSTQYSSTTNSAATALDEPQTAEYGDDSNAWSGDSKNGTQEWLELSYDTPLLSDGALIRENDGNGFVTQVDALDMNGTLHTVWQGTDPSQPGSVVNFHPTWPRTTYPVRGLKIYVDTNHDQNNWEEVDAVALLGTLASSSAPTLASVNPNPVLKGGPAFTMVVNGGNFASGAVVQWNGTPIPTTFVSTSLLTATVPASAVATAGPAAVTVTNPPPGGGTSSPLSVTVGPTLWGDVDGNGTVDVTDATTALKIAAGLSRATALNGGDVAPGYPGSANGYGDRKIDVVDAATILLYLRGG